INASLVIFNPPMYASFPSYWRRFCLPFIIFLSVIYSPFSPHHHVVAQKNAITKLNYNILAMSMNLFNTCPNQALYNLFKSRFPKKNLSITFPIRTDESLSAVRFTSGPSDIGSLLLYIIFDNHIRPPED